MLLQIESSQSRCVDGSKACVGHKDAGQVQSLNQILQKYFLAVKAKGAEDSSGSFHGDAVKGGKERGKLRLHIRENQRISLKAGSQMGRKGLLIDVGAHGLKRLADAGKLLYKCSVSRNQKAVFSFVSSDRGFKIGRMSAQLPELFYNQGRYIGFSHIRSRSGDEEGTPGRDTCCIVLSFCILLFCCFCVKSAFHLSPHSQDGGSVLCLSQRNIRRW